MSCAQALDAHTLHRYPVATMPKRKPRKARRGLTRKQAAFVAHQVANPTASHTASARAAGYSDPGNGSSAIRVRAHEAVTDRNIQAALADAQARAALAADVDASFVVAGLRHQAVRHVDADGAALASVATRALEALGRYVGLDRTRLDVIHHDATLETYDLDTLRAMAMAALDQAPAVRVEALGPGTPEATAGSAQADAQAPVEAPPEAGGAQPIQGYPRTREAFDGETIDDDTSPADLPVGDVAAWNRKLHRKRW